MILSPTSHNELALPVEGDTNTQYVGGGICCCKLAISLVFDPISTTNSSIAACHPPTASTTGFADNTPMTNAAINHETNNSVPLSLNHFEI